MSRAEEVRVRLVVVGAASGVGRQVVEQGLGHGHEIVAVTGGADLDAVHERLTVSRGGLEERDALAASMRDADAVLLAVDPPASDRSKTPYAVIAASVVSAMKLSRVRRLVALSAAGVGESQASVGLLRRIAISTALRAEYAELAAMEEVVLFSGLDWTLVRPADLNDGPLTGLYRVRDNVLPERGKRVSRADAAALMLKALSSRRYVERIVALAD